MKEWCASERVAELRGIDQGRGRDSLSLVPTICSTLLHVYSQDSSACWPCEVMTETRTMAMIMIKTVMQKTLSRPSFCRMLICTFQSMFSGMSMTGDRRLVSLFVLLDGLSEIRCACGGDLLNASVTTSTAQLTRKVVNWKLMALRVEQVAAAC